MQGVLAGGSAGIIIPAPGIIGPAAGRAGGRTPEPVGWPVLPTRTPLNIQTGSRARGLQISIEKYSIQKKRR